MEDPVAAADGRSYARADIGTLDHGGAARRDRPGLFASFFLLFFHFSFFLLGVPKKTAFLQGTVMVPFFCIGKWYPFFFLFFGEFFFGGGGGFP